MGMEPHSSTRHTFKSSWISNPLASVPTRFTAQRTRGLVSGTFRGRFFGLFKLKDKSTINMPNYCEVESYGAGASFILDSQPKNPNLNCTRGITPKRVTIDRAHLRSLTPGQHSYEKSCSGGDERLTTLCPI